MSDTPETTDEVPSRSVSRSPVEVKGASASRFVAPAALLVAVVAVALAIWSLTSASGGSGSAGGGKLAGDPKTRVCTAFDTVSNAVSLQTHTDLGADPVAASAVAGNARLALLGGGQYLANSLDSETPSSLAGPVREFANELQEIGMYALAGVPNTEPAQAGRLTQGDLVRKQIVDLCK